MAGLSQQGDWQLVVTEPNDSEIGRVNSWTLRIAAGELRAALGGEAHRDAQPRRPRRRRRARRLGLGLGLRRHHALRVGPRRRHRLPRGATATTAMRTERFAQRGTRTVRSASATPAGVIGTASVHLIVSHLPNAVIAVPCGSQGADLRDASTARAPTTPDGGAIASYEWDTDGDDDFNDYTGAQPSVYFADARQSHDQAARDRRRRRAAHDDDHGQRDRHHASVAGLRRHAEPGRRPASRSPSTPARRRTTGRSCATSGTSTATAATRPTAAPRRW